LTFGVVSDVSEMAKDEETGGFTEKIEGLKITSFSRFWVLGNWKQWIIMYL